MGDGVGDSDKLEENGQLLRKLYAVTERLGFGFETLIKKDDARDVTEKETDKRLRVLELSNMDFGGKMDLVKSYIDEKKKSDIESEKEKKVRDREEAHDRESRRKERRNSRIAFVAVTITILQFLMQYWAAIKGMFFSP